MYACSVVHVTRICCFELCYLEFSFGYLENLLLRISLSRIFKKGREFFALTLRKMFRKVNDFSWKIGENKGRILFALLLHNTVQYRSKILGPKYAHITRLRFKHARICVYDTRMRYAQKANSLVFMS